MNESIAYSGVPFSIYFTHRDSIFYSSSMWNTIISNALRITCRLKKIPMCHDVGRYKQTSKNVTPARFELAPMKTGA